MTEKSQGVLELIADAARPKFAAEPIGGRAAWDTATWGAATWNTATWNATKFFQRMLLPVEVDRAWASAAGQPDASQFFDRFLAELGVEYSCVESELARIPCTGPVVIVANHPFGMLEGPVLGAMLGRVRGDVKFLANSLLAGVPELREVVIPVDPFGGAVKANWKPLRQSLQWLKAGGLLVTFPAGEVSSLRFPRIEITDPIWNENVAGLIRRSGAASIPVFIHGANGPAFQIAGLIHPRWRTALLPRELANKKGRTIRITIGRAIEAQRMARFESGRDAVDYLSHRTHLLRASHSNVRPEHEKTSPGFRIGRKAAPLAAEADSTQLEAERTALPAENRLATGGDQEVWIATAPEIPATLREIGRLRELSFRAVGEGTGRSLDVDRFDRHYRHLWVWSTKRREIIGAYRLVGTDTVSSSDALYTSTLFRYQPQFFECLGPALELGRSFVRPDAQRSYAALLLLWKGIGAYVARNPRYRTLFGPVSMSREYHPVSRSLCASFLETHCGDPQLAGLIAPKRPFRRPALSGCDTHWLASLMSGVDELSETVADLEADAKGVPVLLRQYLNLGGRVLSFNVDPGFSDVLDALVMVDLTRTAPALLEKYMGKEGSARFRLYQFQIQHAAPETIKQ
jgi:putative hemolysin